MSVPNNPNAVRNAQRAALRARVSPEVRALNNAVRRNTRLTTPEFRRAENNRQANARDVPGVRESQSSQRANARNVPGVRDSENIRRAAATDVPGVRESQSSQRAEARNEPGVRDAENRIRRERIMNLDPQLVAENLERNAQRMRLLRDFEVYRENERCK